MTDEELASAGAGGGELAVESATIALPTCDGVVDRRSYLIERARGRRVVHLGCVDEGFFGARSMSGDLLHAKLLDESSSVVGVDLSEHGLASMSEHLPGEYLLGNVEELESLALPEDAELVIAGELIEHLPNPGRFLEGLDGYLLRTGATAIITTPNAYSWLGASRFAIHGREPTHPDHVTVFSPVTLQRMVEMNGLEIVSMKAHTWLDDRTLKQRIRRVVDRFIMRLRPWMGVGLVIEVRAGRR